MQPPVAPIGLEYLGAAIEAAGFAVDLIDFCLVPFPEGVDNYLERCEPLAIGITIRNTDDCYYLSEAFLLPRIKEMVDHIKGRTPAPIIVGGVGFSVIPEAILSYLDLQIGICGDGEWAFPEVLRRLSKGQPLLDIPGLVYRTERGVRHNPPELRDLSELPLPQRGFIDNRHYFCKGGMGGIETKRGCAQGCIYCADPLAKGRRYRLRPPAVVAAEMKALLDKGIDHLHLCDSEFNLPYGHAVAVCQEIIKRGLGDRIAWYAYLSPVPFSEELALLMRQAGCRGIDFGVDHGDERILKALGREFTAADLKETAAICHRIGIPFMYDLLLGGPGEDRDSLNAAISLMKEISPSRVGISAGVRIYPGTRLAQIALADIKSQGGNVRGATDPSFLFPTFYVSNHLGDDLYPLISYLVDGDARFFFGGGDDANYNYNANLLLQEAIDRGYRGAFWDILRRVAEEGSTTRCV